MDNRNDFAGKLKEANIKYTYYLLALSAAAIGFALNSTKTSTLSKEMIPLGAAIFLWLLSMYFGLRSLRYDSNHMYANITLLDVESGNGEHTGRHPEKIKIASDIIIASMKKFASKSIKYDKIQEWTLYLGTISYIIWRILEMLPKPMPVQYF